MNKRILSLLMALILCLGLAVCISAADGPLLYDDADLLSEDQESAIASRLSQMSDKWSADFVIYTVDSIGDQPILRFSESTFLDNGYGQGSNRDGVILVICMNPHEWGISGHGSGKTAVPTECIDYIGEQFADYLTNEDYYTGLAVYLDVIEQFYEKASSGTPYTSFTIQPVKFSTVVISLVIGLIAAFISTGVMKGKLKTVRTETRANNYFVDGSMNVTRANDFFLYRTVTMTARPKNDNDSDSDSSPSGDFGGGGGSF